MKSFRNASLVSRCAGLLTVALALTTACTDGLTAPTESPDVTRANAVLSTNAVLSSTVTALIPVTALTRNTAVNTVIVRSVKFTQAGGVLAIAELGLRIEVPIGALPRDTMTITVTSQKGRMIAYDFQPHGVKFLKPLVFRQELAGTSWGTGVSGSLEGGYFKSNTQLDPLKNTAQVDEVLPAVILLNRQVTFNIHHFSGYMVSSGRQSSTTDAAF